MRNYGDGWNNLNALVTLNDTAENNVASNGWDLRWKEFHPTCNIATADEAMWIFMDLPGVEREDVRVDFGIGAVVISGLRRYPLEIAKSRVSAMESPVGRFERSVALTSEFDSRFASVHFENGVLKIRIPRIGARMFSPRDLGTEQSVICMN